MLQYHTARVWLLLIKIPDVLPKTITRNQTGNRTVGYSTCLSFWVDSNSELPFANYPLTILPLW